MKILQKNISEGSCLLDVDAEDLEQIFSAALEHLVSRGAMGAEHVDTVLQALLRREAETSTAIGHAVALPHAYLDKLSQQCVVFIRLKRPLNLGAPDGVPTRFMFLLLGPSTAVTEHLETLTNIARLMSDDQFRYEAAEAGTVEEVAQALRRFEARTSPTAAGRAAADDGGLAFTGRFAGGLAQDLARRLPSYASDFRDGLHRKVLASVAFLLFACLAPAVTFGGVMALGTGGQIGVVEMLVASAGCGVAYALLSGQPLIILGGTGPLLVFTVILYGLCDDLGAPFLPTYAYVGLWTSVFVVVMALTDSSALMRYFTRFTDEIFAALISLIFIYEAVTAVGQIFVETHRTDVGHDKAFLSLILTLGTFFIAMNLSRFRRSRYLMPQVREFLADFGPAIALGLMTVLAMFYRGEVELDALRAPDVVGPTVEGRSWLVNPLDATLPMVVWLGAPVPALFAAILVFLDQNITGRIVNSPDHRLRKGAAYHLDLVVVGALVGACSLFGLPWLVAATVRSLNHVRSLATVEEIVSPSGETRERVVHVRENRVSGLAIHAVVGLSVLALPVIKLIPIPVLHGLFLFMGVVSIKGNQFFERLSLWLMDSSLYPSNHYTRRVPRKSIHVFTLVQFLCLAALWATKTGPPMVAILFPLLIALIAPVRLWLARHFEPVHLAVLDAESEPEEEIEEWV